MVTNSTRIVSGIQPSGPLHLGNYFGMIRPAVALQAQGESFYFVADLHALTTVRAAADLRRWSRGVALDLLAAGSTRRARYCSASRRSPR